MRLLGDGKALSRLVDVRGLDNLDAAIARGKGVVMFCSHLGSRATFALLGARGYPVTMIGRATFGDDANKPTLVRMFHRLYRGRAVSYHARVSGISNYPGLFGAAAKAAIALRGNAIVGIAIDAKPKPQDVSRPVAVTFLNKHVSKAPGAVSIAQLTGAPLIMISIHRKEDWCHQVIEISPPVSVEGETADVFARCLALVEADIRRYPAQYVWGLEGFWRLDPDEAGQDFT
ncbi:MAG: lysophospholipid acyltransferase family protein [Nitrososphaerales archaeon]|jgi:KDO2-lipid IV(A) lauroyltransferase